MMRTSTILLATVLAAAVPANAAWERIGSLNVTAGQAAQFNMENFKGNVIGLTARESDIMCDRVTATFDNGEMRPIFKGKLLRSHLIVNAVTALDFSPVKRPRLDDIQHFQNHESLRYRGLFKD